MERIKGRMSFDDCREMIAMYGNRINNDISSKIVNQAVINSLRSLLDLFEQYNRIIETQEITKPALNNAQYINCISVFHKPSDDNGKIRILPYDKNG